MFTGLQARMKEHQPLALYVHCLAHSLNLVLKDSVDEIPEMREFYVWAEEVYLYFHGSILRWILLSTGVPASEIARIVPTSDSTNGKMKTAKKCNKFLVFSFKNYFAHIT